MGCINYAKVHELKTFATVNVMKIQIVVNLSLVMGQIFCNTCRKMVEASSHNPKHLHAAGNPLNPSDKTIAGKFWSSKT